jgi:hypothetical protein
MDRVTSWDPPSSSLALDEQAHWVPEVGLEGPVHITWHHIDEPLQQMGLCRTIITAARLRV